MDYKRGGKLAKQEICACSYEKERQTSGIACVCKAAIAYICGDDPVPKCDDLLRIPSAPCPPPDLLFFLGPGLQARHKLMNATADDSCVSDGHFHN